MQAIVVTCCVLLAMTSGGVWARSLADEDLQERDASKSAPKGLTEDTLKKMVTTAMGAIDKIVKSSQDKDVKAEMTEAKQSLMKDLNESGKVARAITEFEDDDNDDDENDRARRGFRTQYNIGRGWSVGFGGLKYKSRNNRFSFGVKPTFSGFKPNGFHSSFTWRF
ncbi:hypothetical protein ACOMHN_006523 [Nucella lapillus]